MVAQSRVIAKGARIRDVQRLVDTYGVKPSQWVKKGSPTFEHGEIAYQLHWYEHYGIGRFETKLKAVPKK